MVKTESCCTKSEQLLYDLHFFMLANFMGYYWTKVKVVENAFAKAAE